MDIWEYFQKLVGSKEELEQVIRTGGLVLMFLVVYIETGWFFGFFLPGDYFLFLSGMLSEKMEVSHWLVWGVIFLASVLGNLTGFIFGRSVGNSFMNRRETWYFKRSYIENTRVFFEKHGGKALVIGRFLPIIRTFAPLLAGIIRMEWRTFMIYTIVGGFLWSFLLVMSGHYLNELIPGLSDYLEWIILFFLGITSITVVTGYIRLRRQASRQKKANLEKVEQAEQN